MAQAWHRPGMTLARLWHSEQHTKAPAQGSCPSSAPLLRAIQKPGVTHRQGDARAGPPTQGQPSDRDSLVSVQIPTVHSPRRRTRPPRPLGRDKSPPGARAHHGVAKELCLTPERGCRVGRSRAGTLSDTGAPNKSCLQGLCLKRRLIGVIMGAGSALAGKVYKGKLK